MGTKAEMKMSNTTNTLAGTKLEYTYEDGGAVILSLQENTLGYEWISGPFKGTVREGRLYQSRLIGENIHLVNWHDAENAGFATLVIDLDAKKVFGTALVNYRDQEPVALFDEAKISRVSR